MHLARQVYLDYLQNGPIRMNQVADRKYSLDALQSHEYQQRLTRLKTACLCCDTAIPETGVWPDAYYLESNDGSVAGFVEENCFLEMILHDCYGEQRGQLQENSLRELLVESADRSYLLLQQTPLGPDQWQVDYCRLDQHGEKLSNRSQVIKERSVFGTKNESMLMQLFGNIDAEEASKEQKLLLAHRAGTVPTTILEHQAYLQWQTVFSRIRVDLAAENGATADQ